MNEIVECLICNREFTQLSSHLKNKHNMTGNEYRNKFPGAPLMSELLIYNNSGKNGSNWQGGKIISICEQCGEEFDIFLHEKDNRRFCNIKCKKLWFSENKKESLLICDQCGEEFIRHDCEISEGKQFCSRECAKEGRIGEDAANWQGGEITLICDWCGDEFELYKSQINENTRFCSQKCSGEWKSENINGENHPNWKGGLITLICEYCGEEYDCERYRADESKYCSQDCYGFSHRGENSNNWKGGIAPNNYCLLFNEKFKEKIRKIYHRKCFICGKSEIDNRKKLSVHHVNYNKNCLCGIQCEFVPLCQSCHSKTNFNREYWEDTIMNYLYPERYFMVVL